MILESKIEEQKQEESEMRSLSSCFCFSSIDNLGTLYKLPKR